MTGKRLKQFQAGSIRWLPAERLAHTKSEVEGKPGGNPEPGDWLGFVFVFVLCVACRRAGEAKLRVRARCRVFLLGQRLRWEVVLRTLFLRRF